MHADESAPAARWLRRGEPGPRPRGKLRGERVDGGLDQGTWMAALHGQKAELACTPRLESSPRLVRRVRLERGLGGTANGERGGRRVGLQSGQAAIGSGLQSGQAAIGSGRLNRWRHPRRRGRMWRELRARHSTADVGGIRLGSGGEGGRPALLAPHLLAGGPLARRPQPSLELVALDCIGQHARPVLARAVVQALPPVDGCEGLLGDGAYLVLPQVRVLVLTQEAYTARAAEHR